MDEFGDRLRQRLADTAAGAASRPDLREVESRAHRQRVTAGALGGGASLAVVALAVAVVLPLAQDPGVELDPTPPRMADEADDPAGGPEDPSDAEDDDGDAAEAEQPEADPGTPAAACGSMERLAFVVATTDGTLEAVCADGSTGAIATEGDARNPVFTPDGSAIVYEEPGEEESVLWRLDADSAETERLGAGRMPTVADDGRVAFVEGEDPSPTVTVGTPGEEREVSHFMGTMVVRDLAWDPDGERLHLVDNAPEGGGLSTLVAMDPDQSAASAAPPDADDGGRVLAVATSAETGAIGVVRRIGLDQGLVLATTEELPAGEPLSDLAEVTDLAELDLEVDDLSRAQDQAGLWLADGGDLRLTEGTLIDSAEGPSWLIGDGETVWLVTADGASAVLTESAQRAAVNPVADVD